MLVQPCITSKSIIEMRSLSGSKYNENIGKWQTHTWLNISAIFKEQSGDTEALKEESSNL